MIQPAELLTWLAVEGASVDDDIDLIVSLETRAVAFLEELTGRDFGPVAEETVILEGAGASKLWLPEQPIIDALAVPPATITVERETSFEVWETVDAADYVVRGYTLVNRTYWSRCTNYRITYTRGYAEGTEPETIRQAVLDLVAFKYRQRGSEGVKSETMGGYSYTLADVDNVPALADTVGKWRRWVVA